MTLRNHVHANLLATLLACTTLLATSRVHADEPPISPAYAQHLTLAEQPLAAPRAEVAAGVVVVGGGVVTTAMIMLISSMQLCGLDLFEEQEEPSSACAAEQRAQTARGRRIGLGVGVPIIALGAALVGHGAKRIHAIREARRGLALRGADVQLGPQEARVVARFAF